MLSIIIPVQKIKKDLNPRYFYKKIFGIVETINSLKKQIDVDYELIFVINDPLNEELINYIKTLFPLPKFLICSVNVGVSRAWNLGAHMAEGEYLCFCNDDVEFSSKSFSACLNVFNKYERVGEVGPAGTKWNRDKPGEYVGTKYIEETDAVSGFFFIIPTKVYHETGGFDNFYTPAGCEEIDMSFKIRSMGYKCLVVPDTGIVHHGSHGISSKNTVVKYFDKEIDTLELDKKNKKHFLSKWYE
jgi:GT2 family glycosyltransferase